MSGDSYFIEALDTSHHDIQAFRCGKPLLDTALHDGEHLQGFGKTYVVVSNPGDAHILACLTLLPALQEVFSTSAQFTAILLNILAVDYRYQRRGIGKWILSQLIRHIVQLAETYKFDYLLVEPLDNEANNYYEHLNLGFVRLGEIGRAHV